MPTITAAAAHRLQHNALRVIAFGRDAGTVLLRKTHRTGFTTMTTVAAHSHE